MGVDARESRKERRREQVREEILDATKAVLLTSGLPGLTLAAIARELELTKAALYYYFPSKDALVFELLYRALESQAEVVQNAVQDTTSGADALEALMGDTRIIRHGGKIRATRDNAAAMCTLANEAGGMGAYIADWPADDIVGLWTDITKRFKQMGGRSAPYFLRMAGRDTFILTDAVVRALNRWGAIEGEPKGKRGMQSAQEAFNAWAKESGLSLCEISMVLALSAG